MLPVVPLTALPPGVADWVATALVLATLVGALWLLDVRDWRVYGVVLLWPSVIEAVQTANASLPLTLLVAVMWRYRDRAAIAGLALGYGDRASSSSSGPSRYGSHSSAGARLPPSRRSRPPPSLLLLLPFTSIGDYLRLLRNLGADVRTRRVYAVRAADGPRRPGHRRARGDVALGLAVLGLAWRRRSLGLALAAALVLSPIVWRHFFTLLIVPLALSRPRFDAVWLIPIGLWVGDGTLNGAPWQNACVLALVTLTFVLCEWRPRTERRSALTPARPAAEV